MSHLDRSVFQAEEKDLLFLFLIARLQGYFRVGGIQEQLSSQVKRGEFDLALNHPERQTTTVALAKVSCSHRTPFHDLPNISSCRFQGDPMNRLMIQAVLSLSLCPLAVRASAAQQAADAPQSSAITERVEAIKNARTICIHSETLFLTVSTLERSLMMQKNWDQLGLNIVGEECKSDLQINVDRLHFTHIHTYVLTDKSKGIVLAAGRVRALDGVVASGPMAERIVKILSANRLPAQP
jgi:hypothetical protein